MTKYLDSEPFSTFLGTPKYMANWDAIFGKKDKPVVEDTKTEESKKTVEETEKSEESK